MDFFSREINIIIIYGRINSAWPDHKIPSCYNNIDGEERTGYDKKKKKINNAMQQIPSTIYYYYYYAYKLEARRRFARRFLFYFSCSILFSPTNARAYYTHTEPTSGVCVHRYAYTDMRTHTRGKTATAV